MNSKPIVAALAVGLIVFGVALRIRNYAANYSLNHDDICLALNVMNRDIRGLTRTLNFEQAAPLGFLWLERILICIGGSSERSLRLLPVLAGCAAVLMAWPAALTVLRPVEALVVTGYLAFSQDLIAASSQVKPYSLDVFISLFLLWCTVPLFDEQPTWQKLSTAAIGGSLAIWFSFPAIFVMVGFAVVLLISILRSRHRNSLWSILPVLLLWATSAGLAYWFSFRPGLLNSRLAAADANYQFPIYSLNVAFGWLFTALRAVAATMTSVRLAPLTVVALITAIVIALSRRDTVAAVLGAPAILCLLASVAQCYPWFPRLLFFLVPLLGILIVSEIGWLVRANLLPMRRPVVAVAVASLTFRVLAR